MKKVLNFLLTILFFTSITSAQPYNILHNFSGSSDDGWAPKSTFVAIDSSLFGTTFYGGQSNLGTIYKFDLKVNKIKLLHSFSDSPDGHYPNGSLILKDSVFYGMTQMGGEYGFGTIYKIKTKGNEYSVIHSFSGGEFDGQYPHSSLIISDTVLYGMTPFGGKYDKGVIFKINYDGRGFKLLHTFIGNGNDGEKPQGALIQSGLMLYGMSERGGEDNVGTIFKINSDGSNYSVIHHFTLENGNGKYPWSSLISICSYLYGTTMSGGNQKLGTIFKIKPDGTCFELIHSFNNDKTNGTFPLSSFVQYGPYLYGMTYDGGENSKGTIFKINPGNNQFSLLYSFANFSNDGIYPTNDLIVYNGTFYGIANQGGYYGKGTIFSLKSQDFWAQCSIESFEFPDFSNVNKLILNSSARKKDSVVRINSASQFSNGSMFYNEPEIISGGFRTTFSFRFSDGYNNYNDGSPDGGDGLAFIIQTNSLKATGASGYGIGYAGIPNSLAVEFDTYRNDDFPAYDCGDPNGSHIAVFSNGKLPNSSNHRTLALLGSSSKIPVFKADSTIYYAKIEYNGENRKMRIWLDTTGEYKDAVLEINSINFSSLLELIEGNKAYIGFTSSTGKSYQNTDLLSWSFCPFKMENITGITEQKETANQSQIIISPNPVKDILKIKLKPTNTVLNMEIKLVDIFGRILIWQSKESNNNADIEFNVENFPSGLYFLIISNGYNTSVEKVIKE
jgi:uncharacterized repeat protein (TIGR03803 family)